MTRDEIKTEIINLRFNTSPTKAAQVEKWITQAEIAVWNAADWIFKRVAPTTLTTATGDQTPTMAADFGKAIDLYDQFGAPVDYVEPDEFFRRYRWDTNQGTRAARYTVVNREIYLHPIPNSIVNLSLSYRRRYAHKADGSAITAGVMNSANNTPMWDSEHHYLLVPWAIILGQKLENDPTAEDLRIQRDELLAAMKEDLVGGIEGGREGERPMPAPSELALAEAGK